ncbi:hypothetical protein L3073_14235 [Ancylomarina sp. DW003]|nr:hypothetical protein [Ancylomarina sp. DW003]MDE5423375.1 hypothetical protein [Ancylomarina sp. DW003]
MKKTFILLIALAISTLAIGQEKKTEQIREAGLTFRNLDNFGFSYKIGTKQSLWRFNAVSISGNKENKDFSGGDRDSNHFGVGLSVGKESRKPIAKNLEYRFGFDFSFNYNHSKRTQPTYYNSSYIDTEVKTDFYTPGVNMVLGLNYIVNEHFVFGAEIMPFINYTIGRTRTGEDNNKETTDHTNFSYGLDSSSVLLSLAYRF